MDTEKLEKIKDTISLSSILIIRHGLPPRTYFFGVLDGLITIAQYITRKEYEHLVEWIREEFEE